MNIYNYNHLFYFYVTAKLGGVTVAAKHLNTSQSSLSTQVKTLEAMLSKELFHKTGRTMELTDAGKELYQYCRRAFEVFDEMTDQFTQKKSAMGVRISVGVSVESDRSFVTDALAAVSQQYKPNQRPLLNLISLPTKQLLQQLKLGEIDLLLSSGIGVDDDVNNLGDFDFPVGSFASPKYIKNQKAGSLDEVAKLEDTSFVLPSKLTNLRIETDNYLLRKKIRPTVVFESNIISSVVRAATDHLGIAILPQVFVQQELRTGRLLPLSQKALWKHRKALFGRQQETDEGRKTFADQLIRYLKAAANQELNTGY